MNEANSQKLGQVRNVKDLVNLTMDKRSDQVR